MMEYNECDNDPYSGNGTGIGPCTGSLHRI